MKARATPRRWLSTREWEIAELRADGHSTREIADRIGLRPGTVEWHLRMARFRLGLPDLVALADWVRAERARGADEPRSAGPAGRRAVEPSASLPAPRTG